MNIRLAQTILGVSIDDDKSLIRSRWRKLALLHHPDRGGDAEKFRMAADAYQTLMDPILAEPQSGIMKLGGPAPRRKTNRLRYVNPWYWEEQTWLEEEFGHLGFWTRKGRRR